MRLQLRWQVLGFILGCMLAVARTGTAAAFVVSSSEDSGPGTFREAVASANANIGPDNIIFAVANSVTVFSPVTVTDPVSIDGRGATLGAFNQNIDLLELNSGSDHSLVRNLAFVSGGVGLVVSSSGNTVQACRFGTDWSDAAARGNTLGALISGNQNIIGGSAAGQANVFSGNFTYGLQITGARNWVAGNILGLNSAGTAALRNAWYGMELEGSYDIIGGLGAGEGNVFAGNGQQGLTDNGAYCQLLGNYFGFSRAGNLVILNGNNTDMIGYSAYNHYERNYFARRMYFINSVGNTLVANVVGMYPNGSGFSGSARNGVYLGTGCAGNFVGLAGGNGNLFAGTSSYGVEISSATTLNNAVWGNTIVACAALPIGVTNGSQNGQLPPAITLAATGGPVTGTADPGEYIELFLAEGPGANDGTVRYLGSAQADGSGNWQIPAVAAAAGQYLCATATDAQNNTSQLSAKAAVIPPTPTPTATASATFTPTPTVSPTPTISATSTLSPTVTLTPTITPTRTATPLNLLLGIDLGGKVLLAVPNPAKDQMTFVFQLDAAARVTIRLYNLAGEQVAVLAGDLPSSRQSLVWDLRGAAPGVYMARMFINGEAKTKIKVAVMK
jgi:hypothetical protein